MKDDKPLDEYRKPEWADEIGFPWEGGFDTATEMKCATYLTREDIENMTPQRLTEMHDRTGYSRAQIDHTVELVRDRASAYTTKRT